MPYQVNWFLPKRIVLLEYHGELTESELYASDADLYRLYDDGDADGSHIHQICVFEATARHNSLGVLMSLKWPKHPRSGWMIGIGKRHTLERIIGGFAAQLFKLHFRTTENIDQAVDFLYSVDATLPKAKRPPLKTTSGEHEP